MISELLQAGQIKQFSKGELPIIKGDKLDSIYFIVKGLVRGYYIDFDGKEVTKCFSAENEFFGSEGFFYNDNSSFYVQCLEDVKVIKVPYIKIRNWMQNDITHINYINSLLIKYNKLTEDRNMNLLMNDAAQRYEIFKQKYSYIEKRLKQKYIASYLGINAVSLSRLKKQNLT